MSIIVSLYPLSEHSFISPHSDRAIAAIFVDITVLRNDLKTYLVTVPKLFYLHLIYGDVPP